MRRVGVVLVAALSLAACAKTATYTKAAKFKHGTLPGEWKPTKIGGMAIAFYNAGYGATAGVAPECSGISDMTLESLAQQSLVGLEEREMVEESRVTVDGREALALVVKGSVDGVAMVMNLVVFRKDGCVYDLSLVSRPDSFAKAREEFRGFVVGFTLVE